MVKGIDVSHYQKVNDWLAVLNDGVEFVFFKAMQGDAYKDPTFVKNVQGAKTAGLDPKAYLFYDPTDDWLDQVDNFLADLKPYGIKEVALDLETIETKWDQNTPEYHLQMLRAVISKLLQAGMVVVIYATYGFIMKYLPNADCFSQCELWLAHYSETMGPIPPPWKTATYWQYSEKGQVSGIVGPVDMDFFLVD
jgi:lysozyme